MSWRWRGAYGFLLPLQVLAALHAGWWFRIDHHFPAAADARNTDKTRGNRRGRTPRTHHPILLWIEAPDDHAGRG